MLGLFQQRFPVGDPAVLDRQTPAIAPVAAGLERPFWSVMIPAYNCGSYLRRTLASILAQDPGPQRMQIEVVDDHSPRDDLAAVVREVGCGRVHYYRQPQNRGLPQNWTTCIERARGHWLHILHGDDMVLPGYYQACEQRIQQHPAIVLIHGQCVTIDEHDRWIGLIGEPPPLDGPLTPDFARRQAFFNLCPFPSVAVRRDAYEKVGGFCSYFGYVPDVHMWQRLGEVGPVAHLDRPFTLHRIHRGQETNRQIEMGRDIQELLELTSWNERRLARTGPLPVEAQDWIARLARVADRNAWQLRVQGYRQGAYRQALWALRLQPSWKRFSFAAKCWLRWKIRGDVRTSQSP